MNSSVTHPFSEWLSGQPKNGSSWLQPLQEKGRQEYLRTGLPTTKGESWRYTNLRDLEKITFTHPSAFDLPSKPASGLWVVNGRYRPDLSIVPDGVIVDFLATPHPNPLPQGEREKVGTLASPSLSPLVALNTALFEDILVIRVSSNTVINTPVEITFAASSTDQPIAAFPRLLIIAEENIQATIIERHTGQGTQPYFSNSVIEIWGHKNSRLQHYMIQQEAAQGYHISTVAVRLEEGASCDSFIFHTGGKLARREVYAKLNGPRVDFRLNGAYLARDKQHMDITTFIDHAQPQCTSREVVKGVIDDHGRAVFQGKIRVAPGAQKTDGYQLNKALLLSDAAEIDSKPELEIYADDVKCSHGATVGELDDQALFYLRARGIDEATARRLLIQAFLDDVVMEIQNDDVRGQIQNMIHQTLSA